MSIAPVINMFAPKESKRIPTMTSKIDFDKGTFEFIWPISVSFLFGECIIANQVYAIIQANRIRPSIRIISPSMQKYVKSRHTIM